MHLRIIFITGVLLQLAVFSFGQKVSEILESGKPIKKNGKIFLIKDNSQFQFDIEDNSRIQLNGNYKPFIDSTIFLLDENNVNLFLQPLNPLKFSYDTSSKFILDPIDAAADKAFSSITSLFSTVIGSQEPEAGAPNTKPDKGNTCNCPTCATSMEQIKNDLNTINGQLGRDPKNKINDIFRFLRDTLDFSNMARTNAGIGAANINITNVNKYFDSLKTNIDKLESDINHSFKCNRDDSLIIKYVLVEILNDVKGSYTSKLTRMTNLQKAYSLVKTAADSASMPSPKGVAGFGEPIQVSVVRGKIKLQTITVNTSGMELKNDEIVASDKKQFMQKTIRFRRYQLLIPEVSAGIAYSFLRFPKYGTTTDAAGNSIVSSAGEDVFKKLNFTAMINWVLYAHSDVLPFIQIGVGAKTDYPILLTGAGLRFNVGGKTVALSVGAASTWVKDLNKLHIGDHVAGTSDLEKDLTYTFKAPKLYAGFQYNF